MGRARFLLCNRFILFIFFSFVGELNQTSSRPHSQWDFQSRNLGCFNDEMVYEMNHIRI